MDNIRLRFPEVAAIDERIWNEVCQQTQLYQINAAYILLDLQQSYRTCWRILMSKRCALMLLKYESTAINELYETGMLGETEYTRILDLIEKKLFRLEFYRVRMPRGQPKAIENAFDLLVLFQSLPDTDKARWEIILKGEHQWFQPGKILLEKDQTVSTAYLIARGIVECEVDSSPVYFRSGNIIGIDALFSQTFPVHGKYIVSGGLVEAYTIHVDLLSEMLNDEYLAPLLYREIALHLLSNNYSSNLRVNRSELKLLLQKRAKFYHNQSDMIILLKSNERLLLLSGNIIQSIDNQNHLYGAIQFKIFETDTEIQINTSTVAFVWTNNDETHCAKSKDHKVSFPVRTFGSVSNDLLYPGYSNEGMGSSETRHSIQVMRQTGPFKNIQEMPSATEITLEHKF